MDGVSYEIHAGEIVGLLGPNGAGKTTSFRMTTGQLAPNGGRVFFNGTDVTDRSDATSAAHALGVALGCRVLRAHDVRAARRVARVIGAILEAA